MIICCSAEAGLEFHPSLELLTHGGHHLEVIVDGERGALVEKAMAYSHEALYILCRGRGFGGGSVARVQATLRECRIPASRVAVTEGDWRNPMALYETVTKLVQERSKAQTRRAAAKTQVIGRTGPAPLEVEPSGAPIEELGALIAFPEPIAPTQTAQSEPASSAPTPSEPPASTGSTSPGPTPESASPLPVADASSALVAEQRLLELFAVPTHPLAQAPERHALPRAVTVDDEDIVVPSRKRTTVFASVVAASVAFIGLALNLTASPDPLVPQAPVVVIRAETDNIDENAEQAEPLPDDVAPANASAAAPSVATSSIPSAKSPVEGSDAKLKKLLAKGSILRQGDLLMAARPRKTDFRKGEHACAELKLADLRGWRLPSLGELHQLTRAKRLRQGLYWSATDAGFGDHGLVWNAKKKQATPMSKKWRSGRVVCVLDTTPSAP